MRALETGVLHDAFHLAFTNMTNHRMRAESVLLLQPVPHFAGPVEATTDLAVVKDPFDLDQHQPITLTTR